MSDPIDAASDNVEAFTEFAIQSKRPTPDETDAFWRMMADLEAKDTDK